MWVMWLVAFLAILLPFLYQQFTYWQRKGVPVPYRPNFLWGHSGKLVFEKQQFGFFFKDVYKKFKEQNVKFGGVYLFFSKVFVPIDLDLIKQILVKEFDTFHNRGLFTNEKVDPLSANLFGLSDDKWKSMRVKLTPTFTSGKMKLIFETMLDCTKDLENVIDKFSKTGKPASIKEILAQFGTDVIGSCAFGLNIDAQKNMDNTFKKTAERFFNNIPVLGQFLSEFLLKLIRYKSIPDDVSDFYINLIKDTVEHREKNNIYRKDFLHLLIQLKNRGVADGKEQIKADDGSVGENGLSINEVAAQAFAFFLAGLDGSSSAVTYALYEIAKNVDIQDKLQQEIRDFLKKNNGEIDYGSLMEMKYLDAVVNESLRKYPVAPNILRTCCEDYTIPGTDIILEKGTKIIIPTLGIHHDEEYYPEPEKFDPERFNDKNKHSRSSFAYLPFGEGPRICIGMRFAVMQIKVALISVLKNHSIALNKKTPERLTFQSNTPLLDPRNQIVLDIKRVY